MNSNNSPVARGHLTVTRSRMANEYLPKALNRIVLAIDSDNEQVALGASKWIAEMVLGKPRNTEEDAGSNEEMAKTLAATLRTVIERQRLEQPVVVEGSTVNRGILNNVEDFPG